MDEQEDGVGQLYRRSSREEPPARLDLAVMDGARRALRQRPRSPFGRHWLATGAVAAVALVSVVLVLFMQERPEMTAPDTALTDVPAMQAPEAGRIRLPLPPAGKRPEPAGDARARSDARGESAVVSPEPTAAARSDAVAEVPAQGPPQPRFDFYRTLPEAQVTVPESGPEPARETRRDGESPSPGTRSEAVAPAEAERAGAGLPAVTPPAVPVPYAAASASGTTDSVTVAPAPGYYLQVGAFRAADSAARLRGRLEALQLPAGVEAIELENREVWHRVRVGPYGDMAGVERAQARLQAAGIDSLLVRLPESGP